MVDHRVMAQLRVFNQEEADHDIESTTSVDFYVERGGARAARPVKLTQAHDKHT